MGTECEIFLVTRNGKESTQKIIDCLKTYLGNMPAYLKETKEQLTVLGFYEYQYHERLQYLIEAKKAIV
jgi:hypothetical protein